MKCLIIVFCKLSINKLWHVFVFSKVQIQIIVLQCVFFKNLHFFLQWWCSHIYMNTVKESLSFTDMSCIRRNLSLYRWRRISHPLELKSLCKTFVKWVDAPRYRDQEEICSKKKKNDWKFVVVLTNLFYIFVSHLFTTRNRENELFLFVES